MDWLCSFKLALPDISPINNRQSCLARGHFCGFVAKYWYSRNPSSKCLLVSFASWSSSGRNPRLRQAPLWLIVGFRGDLSEIRWENAGRRAEVSCHGSQILLAGEINSLVAQRRRAGAKGVRCCAPAVAYDTSPHVGCCIGTRVPIWERVERQQLRRFPLPYVNFRSLYGNLLKMQESSD